MRNSFEPAVYFFDTVQKEDIFIHTPIMIRYFMVGMKA